MRSRTVREGSVGLLILLGLALFGGFVLWVRGLNPGSKSYKIIVDFGNVSGMQIGSTVRYRGVTVGKIAAMNPGPNGVALTLEITSTDLVIPRDVLVEANQTGLIGETYIDIKPLKELPVGLAVAKPTDPKCDPDLIICNQTHLSGQTGVSSDELFRSTIRLANVYTDPTFVKNLNTATENAAVAAGEIAKVSRDFSGLSTSIRQQMNSFSGAANSINRAAIQSSDRVSYAANQIGSTANKFGNTANQFGNTANQFSRTATQLSQVAGSVNSLVLENRSTLVSTLNNLSESSQQLRNSVSSITPTLNKVNSGKLIQNLESLSTNAAEASANAAAASANLRDFSTSLNNPTNLVMLQQTLDSARATFENAQKITADLDDLTGDPAFRSNLRNLVNGLGNLVSSSQQLQQQIQVAQVLEPAGSKMNRSMSRLNVVTKPLVNTASIQQAPVQVYQQAAPTNQLIPLTRDRATPILRDRIQQPFNLVPQASPTEPLIQPLAPTVAEKLVPSPTVAEKSPQPVTPSQPSH